jgi:hypothetical protein
MGCLEVARLAWVLLPTLNSLLYLGESRFSIGVLVVLDSAWFPGNAGNNSKLALWRLFWSCSLLPSGKTSLGAQLNQCLRGKTRERKQNAAFNEYDHLANRVFALSDWTAQSHRNLPPQTNGWE